MKVLLNLPMGDPIHERTIDVTIPDGYGAVYTGKVQKGDLYLNHRLASSTRDGKPVIEWRQVDPKNDIDLLVKAYMFIIRPGVSHEKPCERCSVCQRVPSERYCLYCRWLIINHGRRTASHRV